MKDIALLTKAPYECSAFELADFAAFVSAGGEVQREGLEQRIKEAHALCFLRTGECGCLIGIAAIKNPSSTYRASLFKKAKAIQDPSLFTFELGWVFVLPSYRGKQLSQKLISAALQSTTGERVFATSRTDNPAIHASLTKALFAPNGQAFASTRSSHRLQLLILASQTT